MRGHCGHVLGSGRSITKQSLRGHWCWEWQVNHQTKSLQHSLQVKFNLKLCSGIERLETRMGTSVDFDLATALVSSTSGVFIHLL